MHLSQLPPIEGVIRTDGKNKSVIVDIDDLKRFLSKIRWEGRIDEIQYMENYKDVADAIRDGKVKSATHHYIRAGYVEGRKAEILPD